jgi:mono/diheme cytochrome c family protein
MRYFLLIFGLLVLGVMFVLGKRGDMSRRPPTFVIPDMDRQPKLRPQKDYSFFGDQRSSRLHIDGTVARGDQYQNNPTTTGRIPSVANTTNFVETIPLPVDERFMARGRERYVINCSPCHGAIGDGNGITKKFGMTVIANLHDARIVSMPDGELFHIITHGRNLMGPYAGQVEINDRWAIIAFVRALQRSRLGSVDDVPAPQRAQLGK